MEKQWHEILIQNDEGDAPFAVVAPMLIEALRLIAVTRTLPFALDVACRESEMSFMDTSRHLFRSVREDIEPLHDVVAAQINSVFTSFSGIHSSKTTTELSLAHSTTFSRQESLLQCLDGLVGPRELQLHKFIEFHSSLNYTTFHSQFERLCQIASDGQLFTACEPRIKILQSRYRLYRTFNGTREDQFHPTLGGGDIKRAPKIDVRRVNTCMTASTLIAFMEHTLAKTPDLMLRPQRAEKHRVEKVRIDDEGDEPRNPNNMKHKESSEEYENGGGVMLQSLANAFFGPYLAPEERYFTPDGLCLLPNYTVTSERYFDIFDSRDTTKPHALNAMPLLRQFLDLHCGNDGELLARLVMPMLSRVTSNPMDVMELEFTVSGRVSGELMYIASWCARSGLLDRGLNVQLSLRIVQQSLAAADGVCTARTLEDVMQNIFNPIWFALLRQEAHQDVVNFLRCLVSVAVAVDCSAELQELPVLNNPKAYAVGTNVTAPDAFFVFHVWRNVQLINSMITANVYLATNQNNEKGEAATRAHDEDNVRRGRSLLDKFAKVTSTLPPNSFFRQSKPVMTRPLHFRLHTSETSRNAFMESVLGLLVADDVVNPANVFIWSPLAYLYFLTQRKIVVTPSRNRNNTTLDNALQGAVPFIVETGLNGTVISLDPLHYHTSDDALCEELNGLLKTHNLSTADVTELCHRSAEGTNWSVKRRCAVLCGPWRRVRAPHNIFTKTQVNSLRLHFRESCLAHEVDLLCRKGLASEDAFVLPWCGAKLQREALQHNTKDLQRDVLWSFFDVPRTRAIQREAKGYDGRRGFTEKQVQFPRIVIAGPHFGERSNDARSIARMLLRQQYYASFNIHYEPPPPSLQSVQTASKSGRVNEIFLISSQPTAPLLAGGEIAQRLHQSMESTRHSSVCTPALSRNWIIEAPDRFHFSGGVCDVVLPPHSTEGTRKHFRPLPPWSEFQRDARSLRMLSGKRSMQHYAQKRLGMLECKFNLHVALTNDDEETPKGSNGGALLNNKGDMYNSVKVDVHCHMAAGMTAKELLRFIKDKVHNHSGDIVDVDKKTGRPITLAEMFCGLRTQQNESVNVEKLTVATLEVKAGNSTFNRFDRFNGRYNPLGISAIRKLFLKTENFMEGRYFAELIRETFRRQAEEGTTFSEYRLSIYGQNRTEWDCLSRWFVLHGMSNSTNRWMVQIPRLYSIYRQSGTVASFGEMLKNIFMPLWEASKNPERYPFLNYFLAHVSGFDSVDNESEREHDALIDTIPEEWTSTANPPFTYWAYYMWANITALNRYRSAKGMSTFSYRPHAGESGDPDHLADTFLLADGVNHGINLKDRPVLQYLYYLAQIPLGITPLSNNALFCKYHENPFPIFFRRGLNVALSTDGALTFHHTEQPLIEEYSTAANFWNLSSADISEIARNSILMSGFPSHQKKLWLGDLYVMRSAVGNDVKLSNVPQTRCTFRYELYLEELNYLLARASIDVPVRPIMEPHLEELYVMDAVGLTREQVIERRIRGESINSPPPPPPPPPLQGRAKDGGRELPTKTFITASSRL